MKLYGMDVINTLEPAKCVSVSFGAIKLLLLSVVRCNTILDLYSCQVRY